MPIPDVDAARFADLAALYRACAIVFEDLVADTDWRRQAGSPAHDDYERLAGKIPALPTETPLRITKVVHWYLYGASRHLGGLAALYAAREVLLTPGVLVRGVLEHCSRVLWVLGSPAEPVESRLGRAYLESLWSAEQAKKTCGHLLGKQHPEYQRMAERFRSLGREATAIFLDSRDGSGRWRLSDQTLSGPQDCVTQMLQACDRSLSAEMAEGVYDYYSNLCHPTLYSITELWGRREQDDRETAVLLVTTEAHNKDARFAVLAFYNALSYTMSYHGWAMERHDELTAHIDRLLPGALRAVR